MGESGVLKPDARVELLDGEIIDMAPIGNFHCGSVNRLVRIFVKLLAQNRCVISPQNSLALDEHSEPQPDLMLLKPEPDDYTTHLATPDDVFLLIEVSDTTIKYDRNQKLPAYGKAGIREVWILNLPEQVLEIYREPHYTGFGSSVILRAGEKACPQAFPDVTIDVTELLRRTK